MAGYNVSPIDRSMRVVLHLLLDGPSTAASIAAKVGCRTEEIWRHLRMARRVGLIEVVGSVSADERRGADGYRPGGTRPYLWALVKGRR